MEPKVYVPYKGTAHDVPRPIEVERKRRNYASINITEMFKENAIIDRLKNHFLDLKKGGVLSVPLTLFDNFDYHSHPMSAWAKYIKQAKSDNGLPARALYLSYQLDDALVEWRPCKVIDCDLSKDVFVVDYISSDKSRGMMGPPPTRTTLDAIFVCFDVEDPFLYNERMKYALDYKDKTIAALALSLYVDCMPVDNIKPLDSEQVNRILSTALNIEKLRQNPLLDTSSLLQQYNLNHMRSLNQMILVNLLKKQKKDMQMVKAVSLDPSLFPDPSIIFPNRFKLTLDTDVPYEDRVKDFKFASLWSKPEAMQILLQIQIENLALEKANFFAIPEKSQRLEEFSANQLAASTALGTLVKDTWVNAITASVRHNLKDVKKGWFNIDESNLEVYKFSKLKKFMFRINFKMEDTLRDMMYRMVKDYCNMLSTFCPKSVTIASNSQAKVVGGKFPLFTVDLKFIPSTPQVPAKFTYSATPDMLQGAILSAFDGSFKLFKGMVKVERRVLKKLFWAYDPVVGIPPIAESWAQQARDALVELLAKSLAPMDQYLETLVPFLELISIDINEYAAEAEQKYFKDSMNMADLCTVAKSHADQSEVILTQFPTSVSLGLVQIDCKSMRAMLASKHRAISTKLFQLLERKAREYADATIIEFRNMFDVVVVSPSNIEKLTELREFLAGVPQRVNQLSDRIEKNEMYFSLIESSKWQMPMEVMDMRWEVFRWPSKIAAEITKQEKNLRVLEHQFRRSMEEEQQDFAADLANLQSDVNKLKDLTKLKNAAKNAETVRRLKQTIAQADEKVRLFNSREALFNASITEYNELSDVSKVFEPFYDLWDSAEKWLSNKEIWTNGSFLSLDAELVENSVNTLLRNLNKSAKTFDRVNLPQCGAITTQLRDEVDVFRPKVPVITALRNPGMRDRHWNELAEKVNIKLPANKEELTLQKLVDLGLTKHMNEVEKIAEKAGKEFGIETALDKMFAAWENVYLVIEPYGETGTCILKGVDQYMALLDEHITMTQVSRLRSNLFPISQSVYYFRPWLSLHSKDHSKHVLIIGIPPYK
jgi:dynein heavy chain, axonemal